MKKESPYIITILFKFTKRHIESTSGAIICCSSFYTLKENVNITNTVDTYKKVSATCHLTSWIIIIFLDSLCPLGLFWKVRFIKHLKNNTRSICYSQFIYFNLFAHLILIVSIYSSIHSSITEISSWAQVSVTNNNNTNVLRTISKEIITSIISCLKNNTQINT